MNRSIPGVDGHRKFFVNDVVKYILLHSLFFFKDIKLNNMPYFYILTEMNRYLEIPLPEGFSSDHSAILLSLKNIVFT